MSKINEEIPNRIKPMPNTIEPIQQYSYCMNCPLMCENSYMLRNQMMYEYDGEDFVDAREYRPGPGGGHGQGGHGSGGGQGPGGGHGSGGGYGHKVWHGHPGYYGNKYYPDINYYYFLLSQFYPYYPYDPYYDYYYNTY